MKKLSIINAGVLGMVLFALLFTSCRKKINPAHPTAANNRVLSYSKYITSNEGIPVSQNFRFYYDDRGRLIQIAYTSNDIGEVNASTAQRLISFTYVNDTIFKTTTAVFTATVMERDTFVQNSQKQIIHAYFPDHESHYEYFGKLITKDSRRVNDVAGYVAAGTTYTSNNGDLLNRSFEGTLTANFTNDSGVSFFEFPHDTVFTTPFNTVTWTDHGSVLGTVQTPSVTTTHSAVQTTIDVLTGYNTGNMVTVSAIDANGVVSYSLVWPGGIWPREGYFVYPDLENRPGDYMQIESFTLYGANVYQNAHLIRKIVPQNGPVTDVVYTIDADSKVNQTYVTHSDLQGRVFATEVYKIQYETF